MEAQALTLQHAADTAVNEYFRNSYGKSNVNMDIKIKQMLRIADLKEQESEAWHNLSVSDDTDLNVKNMAKNKAETANVYANGWRQNVDDYKRNANASGGKSKRRKSRRRKSNKRIKSNKRR